jgi:hypothetical protein
VGTLGLVEGVRDDLAVLELNLRGLDVALEGEGVLLPLLVVTVREVCRPLALLMERDKVWRNEEEGHGEPKSSSVTQPTILTLTGVGAPRHL